MAFDLPFSEFYKKQHDILYKKLIAYNIAPDKALDVINSGYYMHSENGFVYDSYYSPMWAMQGQFVFSQFLEILQGNPPLMPIQNKISSVRSTSEILKILRDDPHSSHCLDNGALSFRGQISEFFTQRPVPNPSFATDEGKERLVIPGIYRKYRDDFSKRIVDEKPHWIFNTFQADDLVYYGIADRTTLYERNFKKYGEHNISDLENFLEPENQEYFRGWSQIKVQGMAIPDIAIISQYYGFQTYGLDITFDPHVAAFFATNKFEWKPDGKADYSQIGDGNHSGVIYCFYFRAPQITSTKDLIQSVPAFEFINPVRPIRQSCALPFFHSDRFNEANQFIWHIFKLAPDFDTKAIPSKTHLFPSKEDDLFYKATLDVKQKNKKWSEFVDYDF